MTQKFERLFESLEFAPSSINSRMWQCFEDASSDEEFRGLVCDRMGNLINEATAWIEKVKDLYADENALFPHDKSSIRALKTQKIPEHDEFSGKVKVTCGWCGYSYVAYNILEPDLERLLYAQDENCEGCGNPINIATKTIHSQI